MPWAGGLNAAQYNGIDLNGDGQLDLAVFDRTSNKVNTFIYENGKYAYKPAYELLFPGDVRGWLVLADYNGDGQQDIFTSTIFGMKVYRNVTQPGESLNFESKADPLFTEGTSAQINLQMNITDIPAITDMDRDGDLDILVFDFSGTGTIEYHQNQSMENNAGLEELQFKRVNRRWGGLEDCHCGDFAFGETCQEKQSRERGIQSAKVQHAGGKAILAIDMDGDGDKDLLISDEECSAVFLLINEGSPDNAIFNSVEENFPKHSVPAEFFIFPASYYLDVDADGVKDLLVSPNVPHNIIDQIDFQHSSWFYKNTGTNDLPVFELQQKNFLQDQMIDVGENAAPGFADLDQDGDLDMIIGGKAGEKDSLFKATIQLYENVGSAVSPAFRLKDADYLNLSALNLKNIVPSFVDLNADNRSDLVFKGTSADNEAKLYYLLNLANAGAAFEYNKGQMASLPFNIGLNDHFVLFDLNKDGLPDLLLGKASGRLEYYENSGTAASPAFSLSTDAYLDISDDPNKRNPAPAIADLNGDGKTELITTDESGLMHIYANFLNFTEDSVPESQVILNTPNDEKTYSRLGKLSIPAVADLYGNGLPALVIGSIQGGVYYLKNLSEKKPSTGQEVIVLDLAPNPASDEVKIIVNTAVELEIFTVLGQRIAHNVLLKAGKNIFSVAGLPNGIYLIRAAHPKLEAVKRRLIIQK